MAGVAVVDCLGLHCLYTGFPVVMLCALWCSGLCLGRGFRFVLCGYWDFCGFFGILGLIRCILGCFAFFFCIVLCLMRFIGFGVWV